MPQNVKRISSILLSFCMLCLTACEPHDPDKSADEARLHFEQGHPAIAILELKESLQKAPDHLESIHLLNEIYANLYEYENIRNLLEQSIARGIDEMGVWQSYADALIHLAEFSLAETVVNNNSHHFLNADGLAIQGHLYAGLNESEKAEEFYRTALKLDQQLISAHLGLAQEAVIKAGRTGEKANEESVELIEAPKKQEKNSWVQPSKTMVEVVKEASPLDVAEQHLATVFEQDSENIVAHYLSASIAYIRKDITSAKSHLQNVLSQVSEHPESLLLSGRITLEQGKLNQSAEYLSRYLSHRPQDLNASIYLASIALRQQYPQKALEILAPFDQADQQNIEFLLVAGNSYLYLQESKKAVDYFQKAQALLPEAALTNMYLAMGLLASDQQGKAVVALEKVLAVEPKNEQAGISLVTTLIQIRDFDKAERAVKQLQSHHPRTPMPHYMAGLIYEELNRVDRAIFSHREALKQKHGFIPASLRLAKIYRERNQLEQATEVYEGALYSSPYHPDVLTQMANMHAEAGDEAKSIEVLELARDRNANALNPRLILGGYYLRRAQITEAEEILQELMKIGATRPDVKMFMAQALLSTGRLNEALTLYEELVSVRPDSPEILTRYASALIQSGKMEEGRKALSVAKRIKGSPALDTLQVMGELELKENHFANVIKIAEEIIAKYPDIPAGYLLQGDRLMKQELASEAISYFKQAMTKSDHPPIILKLADAYMKSEQVSNALDLLHDARQRHQKDMRLGLMLANLHRDQGDKEAEIQTYVSLLEEFPDNAVILNNLAWLYEKRDPKKSYEYARQAHNIMPNLPAIQDTLGWFCVLTGRYDEGIGLIKEAIKQAPDNAEFHYHLAEAQLKAGKRDSAKESLSIALASTKSFPQRSQAEALMSQLETQLN